MMSKPRRIELLAPAKDADIAIAAISHGADAVYIGPDRFGARASAGNSISDIARAVEFAHQYNARIYATVNTILFDNELAAAEKLIHSLYKIGVDALIVQDMGILRLDIPPIALHASTQCDTRTVEKAQFLEKAGFSQIVLARELSVSEINAISQHVSVPLECFVHGALCVSYSGRCHASCAYRHRSANRGECAQICRLPYDLTDNLGNTFVSHKHLLSLRDFNQSDRLEELLDAGASSLKIEGRLKDMAYVKNVTAYYSEVLNKICEKHPDRYKRGAIGKATTEFVPDLYKSFNRGFTHYFFDNRNPDGQMASFDSPKSTGEYIGRVLSSKGNSVIIDTQKSLVNGDGLIFVGKDGLLHGFRANRVEGKTVYPQERVSVPKGTAIYRNLDKAFTDILKKDRSAVRKIDIDILCRKTAQGFAIDIKDEQGIEISVSFVHTHQTADASQRTTREKVFGKLGSTIYRLRSLDSGDTDNLFIPASMLTDARRKAIEALQHASAARYNYDYRRTEQTDAMFPSETLTFADNVSNQAASLFYKSHGVKLIEQAMETAGRTDADTIVMTTRYCIRRELGCCLKKKNAKTLPDNLTLTSGDIRLSAEFDCKNCQMVLRKKE